VDLLSDLNDFNLGSSFFEDNFYIESAVRRTLLVRTAYDPSVRRRMAWSFNICTASECIERTRSIVVRGSYTKRRTHSSAPFIFWNITWYVRGFLERESCVCENIYVAKINYRVILINSSSMMVLNNRLKSGF
jgi:hypothetical protein